ncbi:MAG: imidazole glycerol phosphate synthase subunit HisH [Dehalococcoidia bacterium]|nr:imidazole glycerol phosphate synthase subunit HisH [Dehalococcoidia bacterium]
MVCIIDYGAGNLSSVVKAMRRLGAAPLVSSDPSKVKSARVLVLPGVGAAGDAMGRLRDLGLDRVIVDSLGRGVPFLGICLGMQVLLASSEENGGQNCLGVVSGTVKRLPAGLKVPHMGWNQVRQQVSHPLFEGIQDSSDFYFVHSFYPDPQDRGVLAGETEYGVAFCSMLVMDNIVATQFHPEKSGSQGLRLLENFLKFAKA